ncbi:hypothetical protein lerEdw1_017261 [Lerista edwardsae]|nr:hypothetical protein lerEdw1_017261 [Lerista edwardsae]
MYGRSTNLWPAGIVSSGLYRSRAPGLHAAGTTMGANSSSPEVLANNPEHLARQDSPFRLLTVRILRARNVRKADTFTESDCYVTVSLPTASSETVRTKTVPNSKDPSWNQAFSYRIDSRVKNVVHLGVYDEDTLSKDDELYTVVFDTSKLHVGHTSRVSFKLNPETFEELDVEFTLQSVPRRPENIVTNGVVAARETTLLEIKVDIEKLKQQYTSGDLILTIKGSYEETQKVPLGPDSSFSNSDVLEFHCIKNCQSALEITLPNLSNSGSPVSETVPLTHFPLRRKISIGEDKTFDLYVTARDWKKDLDVRLEYDLCQEEKDFLRKRRKHVAAALKKVLQLEEDLQDDEVPVVAIMTTGGGTRSFTAMYGSLLGLQKMNLLNCITYIAGLSGTTWTMAKLYEDADWSQKYMEEFIDIARKEVTKCKLNCFSMDYLKYYHDELQERTKEGHDTSFIDLWGLVIEAMIHNEKDKQTLSDQQLSVSDGQNPFPIYLAINLKENYSAQDFKDDSLPPKKPHELETQLITPQGPLSLAVRDVLTGRPTITEVPNFMKSFHLNDKYLENEQFATWKGTNLDKFAKYVTEQGIPFPKTELSAEEKKNLKECYVFEDQDNAAAPVVLFFPLVNDTYRKYKAPDLGFTEVKVVRRKKSRML